MSAPIEINESLYEMYLNDCRALGITRPSVSDFIVWKQNEYPELDEDTVEL